MIGSGMDDHAATLEGIAGEILEQTGCDDPPVDAYELAECCGFDLMPTTGSAFMRGKLIYVPTKARSVRQHGQIAHELAHWALRRAKEVDEHPEVRYVAGALMLPRQAFDRDLTASAWDLRALQARHANASAQMIVYRLVGLRDAVASVWDDGKLTARVASPWLPDALRGQRPSRLERRLAKECLEGGEVLQPGKLVWAFPVFTPGWKRVIVVAEAEQLSLRWS